MSALNTTVVGLVVALAGVWAAVATAAAFKIRGVETFAHLEVVLLLIAVFVFFLTWLANWSLGHLPGGFGGEP